MARNDTARDIVHRGRWLLIELAMLTGSALFSSYEVRSCENAYVHTHIPCHSETGIITGRFCVDLSVGLFDVPSYYLYTVNN